MAWVQLFPTNATPISQSVNQIQQNWLWIQNTMDTDHYFNTGAPFDGHHKFMHIPTIGADPAIVLTGVVYQRVNLAGNPMLYYRNAVGGVMQLSTATREQVNIVGAGVWNVIDFAGRPNQVGGLIIYENVAVTGSFLGEYLFIGGGLRVVGVISGIITGYAAVGTILQLTTTAACTIQICLLKMEP